MTAREYKDFSRYADLLVGGECLLPMLFKTSGLKRRQWQVGVRLINTTTNVCAPIEVPMLSQAKLPTNLVAEVFKHTGYVGGKITAQKPTRTAAKNVGRSNERSCLMTALIDANNQFEKYRTQGGQLPEGATNEASGTPQPSQPAAPAQPHRIHPMLATIYGDNDMTYPCFIQPKLDGMRMIAHLHEGKVDLYSRACKDIVGFEPLRKELEPILRDFPAGLYLDGESYTHGQSLQFITGATKNAAISNDPNKAPKYWVFDAFFIDQLDQPQHERTALLERVFAGKTLEMVRIVPTQRASNEAEGDEIYKKFLANKYEGAIYRTMECPYAGGPIANSTTRSACLQKRKQEFSAEFPVVDFTQGRKGTSVGAIIWICQTPSGQNFKVKPNGTLVERYALFKEAKRANGFETQFKDKPMTVVYQDISNDGTPLRARSIGFRDYE